MPAAFTYQFDSSLFKGTTTVNTGLFINGQFVDSSDGATIEYVARFRASMAYMLTTRAVSSTP